MSNIKSQVSIKGVIRSFRLAKWVKKESKWVKLLRQFIKTKDEAILAFLIEKGAVLGFTEKNNIIVTVGRAALAERLAGGTTYTGEINYGALGTGVAPSPQNSSTQLGTEAFRKVAASQAFDDNIAYVDFFYDADDCNGTYTEFANFIDGSASANSGQMFSFIATGGWTKSAAESLFVSCQYTIS